MKTISTLLALLIFLFLGACTHTNVASEEANYIECTEPRPKICTREYRPVCARVDTGKRCVTTPCPTIKFKTYGNACSACGSKKVYGYTPGTCKKQSVLN